VSALKLKYLFGSAHTLIPSAELRALRAENAALRVELAAVKAQDTGVRVRYAKDADYFRVECSNLRASNAALRAALETVQRDFEKHGKCVSNYSDGEYTENYTTRAEMVRAALGEEGAK
jgi:hypothetical protein